MLSFLSENRAPVMTILLMLAFLLLLSAQVRSPDVGARMQSALLSLFSPFAKGGAASVSSVSGFMDRYVDLRGLHEENQALRQEVARLRWERQLLEEESRENRRLKEVLSLQQALTLPTVAAQVVSLELTGPFRVAILDHGTRDGISMNDAVITPEGVIGRITAVSGHMAKLQLLVDPSSGAAAMVERTRVHGMVVGRGIHELEMQYVSTLSEVAVGDYVSTSGLESIYPKGLRIGRVKEVNGSSGLEQHVLLETAVDFSTLEEVLVLVKQPQEAPERLPDLAATGRPGSGS